MLEPTCDSSPESAPNLPVVSDFFHASPDLLCVLGWEGRVQRANPAWRRTMGQIEPHPTGPLWVDCTHPDDRPLVIHQLDQLRADSIARRFESRFRCPDGAYLWLECQAAALPAQRLLYVSARDITDRKFVEGELRR